MPVWDRASVTISSMETVTMRFQFPEKYAMRLVEKPGGKVLAYFTIIDTEIGIEFRDVRLMKGSNGVFVASPFRDYEKNGKKQYSDFWRAAWDEQSSERSERGVAYLEEMTEAAKELYERLSSGSGDSESAAPRRGKAAAAPAKRSARGPVKPPVVDEDDDEEPDLPF